MEIKILKGSFLNLELTFPITIQVLDDTKEEEILDKAFLFLLAYKDELEITNFDIKTERL